MDDTTHLIKLKTRLTSRQATVVLGDPGYVGLPAPASLATARQVSSMISGFMKFVVKK